MADPYKRIELIVTIFLIAGFAFLAVQVLKKPPQTIKDQIRSIPASPEFSNLQNLYNTYKLVELEEEAISELTELLNSNVISERWAAVVSLAALLRENPELEETIVPTLERALEDGDDTIKMVAAAQLLSLGKKEGFPVLIVLLESEGTVFSSEPSEQIKDPSLAFLHQFTEFGGRTSQEWQEWWDQNKNSLFWNSEQGIFQIEEENYEN